MGWKLFIDDERWPKDDSFVIARSSADAIEMIKERGMPDNIAFDHDLGIAFDQNDNQYVDSTMRVVHWIIDQHYDHDLAIPEHFTFTVHSMNPIGARNIRELMTGFLRDIGRM